MATWRTSVLAAVLLGVLAGGCNGESGETGGAGGSDADGGNVEALPVDGEVTPPGSELAFGDVAVIPVASGEVEGTYALRVELERGEPEDLDDVDVDTDLDGMVPYYVRYTFQKVRSDHDQFRVAAAPIYVDARLADGSRVSSVDAPEDWEICPNVALAPVEFEKGEPWATCRTHLVPEAGELVQVAYVGPDESEDESENGYRAQPIVWSG